MANVVYIFFLLLVSTQMTSVIKEHEREQAEEEKRKKAEEKAKAKDDGNGSGTTSPTTENRNDQPVRKDFSFVKTEAVKQLREKCVSSLVDVKYGPLSSRALPTPPRSCALFFKIIAVTFPFTHIFC